MTLFPSAFSCWGSPCVGRTWSTLTGCCRAFGFTCSANQFVITADFKLFHIPSKLDHRKHPRLTPWHARNKSKPVARTIKRGKKPVCFDVIGRGCYVALCRYRKLWDIEVNRTTSCSIKTDIFSRSVSFRVLISHHVTIPYNIVSYHIISYRIL